MKLYYIAFMRLPTPRAHGVAIMRACAAFVRTGVEVELVIPDRSDFKEDPFEHYGVTERFTITRLPMPQTFHRGKLGFFFFYMIFSLRAARYIRKNARAGDVPYSRDAFELSLLGRTLSRRAVWEVHMASGRWWVRRSARRLGCTVVAISSGVKNFWIQEGIPADRFLVAPSGVELDVFATDISKEEARRALDLPHDRSLAVYTGNFTTMGADKGIKDIIDALPHIQNVAFVGVGGADADLAQYESLARAQSVAERVILRGHTSQEKLALYQRAADLLLMPFPDTPHYRTYMSPVKMFEYMASGRPIIASDLPSIREVLNESNALLVAPGSPAAIAHGIEELLNDTEKRERLAARARSDVEQYTWDARARKILQYMRVGGVSARASTNYKTYWRDAIADQLSAEGRERFLPEANKKSDDDDTIFFSRMALWQLEDPTYGLKQFRAVRNDRRIRDFCNELAELFRREIAGEAVPHEAFEDLYKKMEPIWAEVGIKKKMWTGFIQYRFGWMGGKKFVRLLTRGWFEAWVWATAAARKRGRGQVSVLVWSWAQAGGAAKGSAQYNSRILALRDHFLEINRI